MQADLNVSLTAINLLWNAADLLAKRSVHSLSTVENHREETSPNGTASGLLDREKFEELLRFLFQSIQAGCFTQNRVFLCRLNFCRPLSSVSLATAFCPLAQVTVSSILLYCKVKVFP